MPITTPMCDTHESDVAQALCLKHRRLMCFGCALKEAASKDCEVKEIRTLDKKQSLFLRCLLLRQSSSRKEHLMTEHEKKTDELKKDLEQKVAETYEKFNNRLKQLRDDCLESLDKKEQDIKRSDVDCKQRLLAFQKTSNETMEKLSMESIDDVTEIERQINEMETDILTNIEDKQSIVENYFKENPKLVEALMSSGATLSDVALIEQTHYAVIGNTENNHFDFSSEEILDKTNQNTKAPNDENDKTDDSEKDNGDGREGKNSTTSKKMVENPTYEQKTQRSKGLFAGLFSPGKTYALTSFPASNTTEPKHLINKIVHVSDLKREEFSSAFKFSKLINVGDGYIGMASELHNSIVIVRLDGKLFGQKKFTSGKTIMCGMGKCAIATVKDHDIHIDKFKVSDAGLTTAGSIVASERLTNITGFDFDVSSSKFAVSTPEKVITLDKSGKLVKIIPYKSKNNQDKLATVFHFEKQCLYILNIDKKTLKMLSVKKNKEIWKRKFDDSDFTPKCMCLYDDKLCITCGSSIAIYSAASGEPLFRHETSALLEDCLGLCVIDSVVVFSSGSDDFETSSKLAYISI